MRSVKVARALFRSSRGAIFDLRMCFGAMAVRLFVAIQNHLGKWEKLYLILGIEHILLGIDHLLFVLCLLLLVQNWVALLKTVTAWT